MATKKQTGSPSNPKKPIGLILLVFIIIINCGILIHLTAKQKIKEVSVVTEYTLPDKPAFIIKQEGWVSLYVYKIDNGWLLRSHRNLTFIPDKKHAWPFKLFKLKDTLVPRNKSR